MYCLAPQNMKKNDYRPHKLKIIGFIIVILLFVSSSTCDKNRLTGGKTQKCPVISKANTEDELTPPTNNLQVDIYLDATLSMQGFTKTDSFSYYQQTIPLLESAVINTLKGEKVFYKFGNKADALPARNFLQAQKEDFYLDKDFNTKTFIENVIENANPSNLTIVVSDLFQDNADVNQLSEKIKNKFITKGLAVGILAIKSQFNGNIFDVGSNNYSFSFVTTDEATYRPFYIMALGSHSNIVTYFDALEKDGIKNFPLKQRIIFSRFLTEKPSNFNASKIVDTKNINEVSEVLVKNDNNLTDFREFRVKDKSKPASFEAALPFKPLSNDIDLSNELVPEIEALTCTNSGAQNPSAFSGNQNLQAALSVDATFTKPEGLSLKVTVAPEKFDNAEVNAFRVILRPKTIELPKWIAEWNMSDPEIEVWHKNPPSFDGSRTYNLRYFLQTLWSTTQNVHRPKVADFYCYIKPD